MLGVASVAFLVLQRPWKGKKAFQKEHIVPLLIGGFAHGISNLLWLLGLQFSGLIRSLDASPLL